MRLASRLKKMRSSTRILPEWKRSRGPWTRLKGLLPRRGAERSRFLIDNLALLRAFVAVVELQSFTAAGRRLAVVPSTVSKHIAALEQQVAAQLVVRSTKTLSVTEVGLRFYKRCLAILHEVDEAEIEIGDYNSEPQGLLRVSAPVTLATHFLAPIFFRFTQRYPKVTLELSLTPASQDLVASGTDVAIRISSGLDPSLIALKLAPEHAPLLRLAGVPTGEGTAFEAL